MSINTYLKEERLRLGLSQTKLAVLCNVSELTQGRYESGQRIPDALYLERFMAIGGDVNYLLTGVRNTQSNSANQSQLSADELGLVVRYRAAPAALRVAALSVLDSVDKQLLSQLPQYVTGNAVNLHNVGNGNGNVVRIANTVVPAAKRVVKRRVV